MRRLAALSSSLLWTLSACEQPPSHAPDAGRAVDAAAPEQDAGVTFDDSEPPDNAFLAASDWPIYHGDSYARHRSTLRAVEGPAEDVTVTRVDMDGVPVFVLFDADEGIFAVSRGVRGAALWKIDRRTLSVVNRVDLAGAGTFAGVYSFVDASGDPVIAVGRRVVRFEGPAGTLAEEAAADLDATLAPEEALVAASVTFTGEIAVVGSAGTVAVLSADLDGPPLATLQLAGEEVSNALSLDEDGGLYVVGSVAIHRIDWADSTLSERWSVPVEAAFETPRPGRLGTGSGTTPALMGHDRVVVADDAESLNVLVLRRDSGTDAEREVCKIAPFDGPAATDNAIVVSGRMMIVEQNLEGHPGVARVDLGDDGRCQRVWLSDVLAPTCVPTLSTASGMVYVYTYDETAGWALTGLDLETGATRLNVPTGTGNDVNNFYAAVTVGPDQRIYLGVLGGLLVFADGA